MRGLIACLSGGIYSITAAIMVRQLGFHICTGMFIHTGSSDDEEDAIFARDQATYLSVPLFEVTISGEVSKALSPLTVLCLALQLPVMHTITGMTIGWHLKYSFDNEDIDLEYDRNAILQQKFSIVLAMVNKGPCNVHAPLLGFSQTRIAAKAQVLKLATLYRKVEHVA